MILPGFIYFIFNVFYELYYCKEFRQQCYNYLSVKCFDINVNKRSVIKRPTSSTTGTTSGHTDTTSGQTSTTSGQTTPSNGQTNGQTSTTRRKTSMTSGETSTTSK